jgi:hypothetical protein
MARWRGGGRFMLPLVTMDALPPSPPEPQRTILTAAPSALRAIAAASKAVAARLGTERVIVVRPAPGSPAEEAHDVNVDIVDIGLKP